MPFNIEDFKATVGGHGFVHASKYEINIYFGMNSQGQSPLQSAILTTERTQTNMTTVSQELSYRCVNAVLPGVALRTTDINRYGLGVVEKMPFAGNFTDIPLSFYCDRLGLVSNFWNSWINYILALSGNASGTLVSNLTQGGSFYTTEYKENYTATITITSFDPAHGRHLTYIFYQAFPIAINDEAVSWGQQNDLLKLTTTISFKEWQIYNGSLSTGGGIPVASPSSPAPSSSPTIVSTSNIGTATSNTGGV